MQSLAMKRLFISSMVSRAICTTFIASVLPVGEGAAADQDKEGPK
jgi:hypothetical protein